MTEINLLKAEDIMSRDVATASPGTTTVEVVERLLASESSCVVVVDDKESPIGIVSERDLLPLAAKGQGLPAAALRQVLRDEGHVLGYLREIHKASAATAAEIMSSPVHCVDVETSVPAVASTLEAFDFRQLPVTRGGKLAGLVTRRDVVRAVAGLASS